MPARQGLVLEVDRSTPPILFHHGEGFRFEKLPSGSRVIYPNEPVEAISNLPNEPVEVAEPLTEPLTSKATPGFVTPMPTLPEFLIIMAILEASL